MAGLSATTMLKGAARVFGQQTDGAQPGLFKPPVESQTELTHLTEANFSLYLHTKFRISTSPLTAINLELIKVTRREASSSLKSAKTPKLDCFSVIFRGPNNIALESRTYRVVHDQMGAFDLFIAPVDDRKKQRRYQAVFNRVEQ